ncbi:MAG: response regulator [Alphaproteobacteria bacterium]|nr:response regulator [Alphaproteobacteria bacterium]
MMKARPRSLARELALFLAATFVASAALIAFGVWEVLSRRHETDVAASELALVRVRAEQEQARFERIARSHQAAQAIYDQAFATLDARTVNRRFEAAFAALPDGTWRTRDQVFDGANDPTLGAIHGIGGYVAPGPMPAARRRALVAALTALQTVALTEPQSEGLSFFTATNDVIVFAPTRADRLMFYRRSARADFDFQHTPMAQGVTKARNPDGRLRCLPLTRAIWDPSGRALVAGCQTPLRFDQAVRGGWGTTMVMNDRFGALLNHQDAGRAVLVASLDHGIIAATGLGAAETASSEDVAAVAKAYQWPLMRRLIAADARDAGLLRDRHLHHIAAQARVPYTDWRLIYIRDQPGAADALARDAPILALAVIGILSAMLAAFSLFVHRKVIAPLRAIQAQHALDALPTQQDMAIADDAPDEIRELAAALREYRNHSREVQDDLESRVAARTRELSRARDVAEAAASAKSAFLANMSHEIRTPLNGVVGVAGALERTALDERQREMAGLIRSSGETLERLVSDILDVTKIEAGKLELHVESFDLNRAIETAAELMRVRAEEKGIAFNVRFGPQARGFFEGDVVRFRQIVSNLTSNAIKFTSSGSVEVRVDVEDRPDAPSRLTVTVSDTGIGFDAETAARLFTRFEQADASITRNFGGTGLGLAISQSLAGLMGGEVSAISAPGEGSVFTFQVDLERTMPLADFDRREAPAPESEATASAVSDGAPLRILLAEDHPTNQRVACLILEPLGVDLVIAGNGLDAVKAFQTGRFDLVLMDMQMPVMDGLAAVRAIRTLERVGAVGRTPIAMLSANAMQDHVTLAIEAGCDAHIAKPFTPETLIQGIENLLAMSAGPDADEAAAA